MENKTDNTSLRILLALFMHTYDDDSFDYDAVDRFYAHLGYDLELTHELIALGIESTSALQEKLQTLHNEPEKMVVPVVPDFVFNHIKKYKDRGFSLWSAMRYGEEYELETWMTAPNQELYAKAWLAYPNIEAEKRPTYRVELPDPEKNSNTSNTVVLMRTKDGRVVINKINAKRFYEKEETKLTEEEIKRNHEYLWPFAVQVEAEEA